MVLAQLVSADGSAIFRELMEVYNYFTMNLSSNVTTYVLMLQLQENKNIHKF
jgi:hypothetical protein